VIWRYFNSYRLSQGFREYWSIPFIDFETALRARPTTPQRLPEILGDTDLSTYLATPRTLNFTCRVYSRARFENRPVDD
jgi:hypothetical protein